jgi:holo-[acyl-carrier protein] synthase
MIEKMGIGIDIADVNQFKKIPYTEKSNFYKKIFLDSEIEYCIRYRNSYEHFAGKFAIKEAVKKSIKTNVSMLNIETSHSRGKPIIKLGGKLQGKYRFLVSVSHERDFAIAVVISEKNNN